MFYFYDNSNSLDPNSHQWKVIGTGTISQDGSVGVPDAGVGFPKFCCAAVLMCNLNVEINDPGPPDSRGGRGGDPVDFATGQYVLNVTDLVLPARLPISIERGYFSRRGTGVELSAPGPFGFGTTLNFEKEVQPLGTAFSYIQGSNGRTDLFQRQPDGTYQNLRFPFLRGIVITGAPTAPRRMSGWGQVLHCNRFPDRLGPCPGPSDYSSLALSII